MNTSANPAHGLPISIIALTGRPGADKDTVAHIMASLGYEAIAFADLLRAEVAAAWRLDPRMLTERQTKEWDIPALAIGMCSQPEFVGYCFERDLSLHEPHSPRWALQNWATWRRRYDHDYFVRPVQKWISRKVGTGHTKLVITDLRFDNEWHMLDDRGAHILHIYRSTLVIDTDTLLHESEAALAHLPQHANIVNDGTLEALAKAVKTCPIVYGLDAQVGAS